MAMVRYLAPVLVGGLLWATQLGAQVTSGTITGRVVDGATQQPLPGATVQVLGTELRAQTGDDGGFLLTGVPAGAQRLLASRIGYRPQQADVTVIAGATANVQFALQQFVALLEEVVVTGYGTQRREAITGSVSTIDPEAADVGVISNVNEMMQGRAAGVSIVTNNGEPGAGAQVRIRGGTSISASNEPLYVVDGVPIYNVETQPGGYGIGGSPALPRSPLNLINPSDIESITILKDAAATAIYGSRAANGVILVETKKGVAGDASMTYDGYVAFASPSRRLDLLNGDEYRQFVQEQVAAGNLSAARLDNLGSANTDWEREVTRSAVTHNHNLAFTGGTDRTRYRASLNYMNQEGVVVSNAFERIQGRLNASHNALDDRLRLGLNVTAARTNDDYVTFENEGGFEGGVLQNVAVFNPTQPVKITDPATGQETYYEIGTGRQSVRNPVALAEQVQDFGSATRTLGNLSAELELWPGLTAEVNLGADLSEGIRRTYHPRTSPVGAQWNGLAVQETRDNTTVTLQSYLTYSGDVGENHSLDVVGGYEFSELTTTGLRAESQDFITDALSFDALSGGNTVITPFSFRTEERLVSFFGRFNYGLKNRYFLTGVLRYDGSSKFGEGNKWAVFPAVSASWRISEEGFAGETFSDLRLRAGWGLQGNPAVPPYSSLLTLEPSSGVRAVFGDQAVTGVAPVRNPNPNLKWEETEQINVAVDFGLWDNRLSGSVEYYVKSTSDLLLQVDVPQPANVSTRLENVGEVRNRGFEIALDALVIAQPDLSWLTGLTFSAERNEVRDLGGQEFISTGTISGQGQSGQRSQRLIPGEPLGTFYGREFVGVDAQGRQLFQGASGPTLNPTGDDFVILGNANPDYIFGLLNQARWGNLDVSFFIRGSIGQDVFNNTALVYSTQSNALQDKNFLKSALSDSVGIREPAIFSSRWVENASFVRLQNITVGYTFSVAGLIGQARTARAYLSADNLLLLTGYSGLDPEAHTEAGLAARGIDYLSYPRPRTVTAGIRLTF